MTCYTYKTRLNRGLGPQITDRNGVHYETIYQAGPRRPAFFSAGVPAFPHGAGQLADVSITEDVFPDAVFRQWLTDPANLDGARC